MIENPDHKLTLTTSSDMTTYTLYVNEERDEGVIVGGTSPSILRSYSILEKCIEERLVKRRRVDPRQQNDLQKKFDESEAMRIQLLSDLKKYKDNEVLLKDAMKEKDTECNIIVDKLKRKINEVMILDSKLRTLNNEVAEKTKIHEAKVTALVEESRIKYIEMTEKLQTKDAEIASLSEQLDVKDVDQDSMTDLPKVDVTTFKVLSSEESTTDDLPLKIKQVMCHALPEEKERFMELYMKERPWSCHEFKVLYTRFRNRFTRS